jgi:murein DD-endopeptidase MepM/ murein hydrolase activator NlpD
MPTNFNKTATPMKSKRRAVVMTSLLAAALIAVTVTVTAVSMKGNKTSGPGVIDPDQPPVSGAVVFAVPLVEYTSMLKNASFTELQYNATMRRWESHKMVDLEAPLGASVLATYAGRVASIRDNTLYGRQVTIEHANGLKTVYSNLSKTVADGISEGVTVAKGQKIGSVGQTSNIEFVDTPHLRIEVYQNNKRVDPNDYIDFPIK